jgi:hypothetical protein
MACRRLSGRGKHDKGCFTAGPVGSIALMRHALAATAAADQSRNDGKKLLAIAT